MHVKEALKTRLRAQLWLFELHRRRLARAQDAEYLRSREHYFRTAPAVFQSPGYLAHSKRLLHARWTGPKKVRRSPREVRLFVATLTGGSIGGGISVSEVAREFDAYIFDYSTYLPRSGLRGDDRAWRENFQRDLVEAFERVQAERPADLALLEGDYGMYDPDTVRKISSAGTLFAIASGEHKHAFLGDSILRTRSGTKVLIGAADIFIVNDFECLRWYIAEGAPAFYSLWAADPNLFRPIPCEKDIDVSFVGTAFGIRRKLVDAVKKAGIRIAVFGRGWGTSVPTDKEVVEIINRSRINLGCDNVMFSDRIGQTKGRDFQVTMTGNLLLTRYNWELAPMFRIGEEILCYHNEIDCVEQIRYYLDRPDEAEAIARAGSDRALRDHTWTKRMVDFLQWTGILAHSETSLAAELPPL